MKCVFWHKLPIPKYHPSCLNELPLSTVASSLSWCWSCFVSFRFTYEIYSGSCPSMYVYCGVCYCVITDSYVRSVNLFTLLHSCWWLCKAPVLWAAFTQNIAFYFKHVAIIYVTWLLMTLKTRFYAKLKMQWSCLKL